MRLRWFWTPNWIKAEAEWLNNRAQTGWVTIAAHPVYGYARWVVRLEGRPAGKPALTIGSDFSLRTAIGQAREWIKTNAGPNGVWDADAWEQAHPIPSRTEGETHHAERG